MTLATTASRSGRSPLRHLPVLAAGLAAIAVLLPALGPIGWRAGWGHFRFPVQTMMPWAAYCGISGLAVSALALLVGRSRIEWRGVAVAAVAFAVGLLIAYVPWHYDQMRQTVPPIHDITTDPDNPPAFTAIVAARTADGGDPDIYEGAKIAEQQRQAYPDIAPLSLAVPRDAAFNRALDAAQRMGWTIVAADDTAGRIEARERGRWFGVRGGTLVRAT